MQVEPEPEREEANVPQEMSHTFEAEAEADLCRLAGSLRAVSQLLLITNDHPERCSVPSLGDLACLFAVLAEEAVRIGTDVEWLFDAPAKAAEASPEPRNQTSGEENR